MGYIRARSGGEVDGGRVLRVTVAVAVAVLAVVTATTAVGAARQDSLQTRLQRHGVPVAVTVTGCEGVSSGIAQSIEFYLCRGSFTLAGRHHNDVIGGNRAALADGQALAGVTLPDDPGRLSTAAAVGRRSSPWAPWVTPIVLAVLTAGLGLALAALRRRARSG